MFLGFLKSKMNKFLVSERRSSISRHWGPHPSGKTEAFSGAKIDGNCVWRKIVDSWDHSERGKMGRGGYHLTKIKGISRFSTFLFGENGMSAATWVTCDLYGEGTYYKILKPYLSVKWWCHASKFVLIVLMQYIMFRCISPISKISNIVFY